MGRFLLVLLTIVAVMVLVNGVLVAEVTSGAVVRPRPRS